MAAGELAAPDLIVAVGGGGVIDTAKLIAAALSNDLDIRSLLDARFSNAIPIIAAPTTAGSGAERTPFAVAYQDGTKYSVEDPSLLPVGAIVDPSLMESVPSNIAAAALFDALAHALESMWAVRSTPKSRLLAKDACEQILSGFSQGGSSTASRDRLAFGATLAGAAIAVARTTAAHALSYHLTSEYQVPHGAAVALTLGAILRLNADCDDSNCVDPRGSAHVRSAIREACDLLGVDTPLEAQRALRALQVDLGLPQRLSEVGLVAASQRQRFAAAVNQQRLANNPRRLDAVDIRDLVEELA